VIGGKQPVVIVAGSIQIDPDQREAFLAGKATRMRATRGEPGCLEYTFSADPVDPARVLIIERWARQQDLDAHLAAAQSRRAASRAGEPATSASIFVYDVTGERPLEAPLPPSTNDIDE
jgi:quinol monooxygenase YgiN